MTTPETGQVWVNRSRPSSRITITAVGSWTHFTRHGETDHDGTPATGTIPTRDLPRHYQPASEK
ncbi:hypothetical protein ACFY7H_13195 [Streptomyces sp. NPDC012794]|uniref:hypothetical protein n=1 Tax=Streptomyces sp. NPDC012794 TaxID=3364850 RepID=UPI0036949D09